jgi:5'-nucleotidase
LSILITNDDGIYSPGLSILAKSLSALDDVVVVAPDREQSAVGHAITLSNPLRITRIKRENEFLGYACNGTPADAVKLALKVVMPSPPKLLVSGINFGANVGASLLYSGTVSAATEGTLLGIPSIAVSLDSMEMDNLSSAADFALRISETVLANGLPKGIFLNVNVPDLPLSKIKGYKISPQGKTNFNDFFEEREDPRGQKYFWMCGSMVADDENPDHDVNALAEGFISVTPIQFDLTAHEYLNELKNWKI